MTTKTTVSIEQALSELQEAKNGVTEAQDALTTARAELAEKVEQIKGLMDDMKAKASELGVTIVQNVDEAQQAVQEKLDDGKDAWAVEAKETPNAARRKLRLVWGVIGAVGGLIVGLPIGYVLHGVL